MKTDLLRPSFLRSKRAGGFTLVEMLITLAIIALLCGAIFGIITGVLHGVSTIQDNQNYRDQTEAMNAFLKKKLNEISADGAIVSYQRGDGEGLLQNGIIFGDDTELTAIDAKIQANGYYTIRVATFDPVTDVPSTAPAGVMAWQILQGEVTGDDPNLTWTPLIKDVKTLHWQFQSFNGTGWADQWTSPNPKPNLVQFTMQQAGDLQAATMDFWITPLVAATYNAPNNNANPGVNTGGNPANGIPGANGANGLNGANRFNGQNNQNAPVMNGLRGFNNPNGSPNGLGNAPSDDPNRFQSRPH